MDVGGRCPERKHGFSSILLTKDGTQEFVRASRVVALPVCVQMLTLRCMGVA